MLPQHAILFEPMTLGRLRLANRIVLAPTYMCMGDGRGNVTDQSLCYYYTRAAAGVGLIIVEIAAVTGRYAFSPGFGLGVASDRSLPGLRDLARVIHWGGAQAILQLFPGQGAQAFRHHEKHPLVGPSDVPALIQTEGLPKAIVGFRQIVPEVPRPLTIDEIQEMRTFVVRAAERAKRAGFDGVELHGAHGYLLGQFTSPYFNRRDDDYGGSPEERWRLSIEMTREIKDAVGDNFVVGYRFSGREWIPGGLELAESIQMAKAIQQAGADYLSVSHGCYGALTRLFEKEEGALVEDAAAIRKEVAVPVMCPNFQNPDQAAAAIGNGAVDLVALSRALLADPLWAQKAREGRPEEIQQCIRCYGCVRAILVDYLPVRCAVNPMLGFERFHPECLPRPKGDL